MLDDRMKPSERCPRGFTERLCDPQGCCQRGSAESLVVASSNAQLPTRRSWRATTSQHGRRSPLGFGIAVGSEA